MEKQYVGNLLYATKMSLKKSKYLGGIVSKLSMDEIDSLHTVLEILIWNRKLKDGFSFRI